MKEIGQEAAHPGPRLFAQHHAEQADEGDQRRSRGLDPHGGIEEANGKADERRQEKCFQCSLAEVVAGGGTKRRAEVVCS